MNLGNVRILQVTNDWVNFLIIQLSSLQNCLNFADLRILTTMNGPQQLSLAHLKSSKAYTCLYS